jgi:hypothetical protein
VRRGFLSTEIDITKRYGVREDLRGSAGHVSPVGRYTAIWRGSAQVPSGGAATEMFGYQ